MAEQRLSTYIIWTKPFYFGWLLSFPFYGPVLYQAAPEQAVSGAVLVLIFTFFHTLSFLLGGILLKDHSQWYRLMLISLIVTLVTNMALLLPYDFIWPLGMAVLGSFSALYILGWSCLFSLAASLNDRVRIVAALIILANLVLFLFNLLTMALPIQVVQVSTVVPLVIALIILLRFPFSPQQVLQQPALLLPLPKPLLVVFSLFIFILFINGGFMYRIMLPSLGGDFPFYAYYRFVLYVVVLMLIYFYHKKFQRYFFLYMGVSLLGLAFVAFALISRLAVGSLFTSGLVEAGFALLDLFVWITVGTLAFIYRSPFPLFGFTLAAMTGSILIGDFIGDKLLSIGESYRLVTAAFAATSIFLAFTVMPWLNQRIEENMEKVLQREDGKTTPASAETAFDRLLRNLLPGENLTPRELEIIRLALQGLTNQDIAKQLFISQNTVKTHLKNIYQKFGVTKKRELLYLSTRKEGQA